MRTKEQKNEYQREYRNRVKRSKELEESKQKHREKYAKKYCAEHVEERKETQRKYYVAHAEELKEHSKEHSEEMNKYQRKYHRTHKKMRNAWVVDYQGHNGKPVPKGRKKIRGVHGRRYLPFKRVIDPGGLTCIHHAWIPDSVDYDFVAVVEVEQRRQDHANVRPIIFVDGGFSVRFGQYCLDECCV